MGFLGSIGSFFSSAPKAIVKTITSPTKLATAIVTGGASVVAPKITKPVEKAIGSTLFNPALASTALTAVTRGAVPPVPLGGVQPMALNISGLLGQVGQILGGSSIQSLQTIGGLTSIAAQAIPVAVKPPQGGMTRPPAPIGAMPSAAIVGRGFFNKFPNLATAIQSLRNRGANVTRSKLWSLLKRFGPDILISGGILTAAAVSELMMAGPGTRRMNPGNAKALRRSLRRLESFHKLCMRADKFRRPGRRTSKPCGSGAQFVRQG